MGGKVGRKNDPFVSDKTSTKRDRSYSAIDEEKASENFKEYEPNQSKMKDEYVPVNSGGLKAISSEQDDHVFKPLSKDKLKQTQDKVGETMEEVQKTIEKVFQRGESLSDMCERAERLTEESYLFNKSAMKVKRKSWWDNWKMRLIILMIITIFLFVLTITIYEETLPSSSVASNVEPLHASDLKSFSALKSSS